MNIVLMHHSAPPVIGGVESVLEHHARLMSAAGHHVRIVAARGRSWNEAIEFVRLPLVDSLDEEIFAIKKELDAGRIPPAFPSLVNRLIGLLHSAVSSADVLIAHNVCSLNKNLVLTDALHHLYREPNFPQLVLWHHDLAWTTPRYLPELHPGQPWDLLRDKWPGAIHVAVSDFRQRELSTLTGIPAEQIRVIPNGIQVEEFLQLEEKTAGFVNRLNLLQAAPLLLVPVRITPRKNLELAIRTLACLREVFPAASMVVTGPIGAHNPENQKYFQDLLTLRRTRCMDSAFHFLAELDDDWLSDTVISDFYRLADAVFLPSREEGFGIPLLEAGISRRPVFCADLPTLKELGAESATYFSPDDDPERVASLIAGRLRNDPIFRLAETVRGGFQWNRIYQERIEPLLKEAAGRSSIRGNGS